MRLFKIGRLRTNKKIGIRVLILHWINPLRQIIDMLKSILWLRRTGYLRVLRLPCFKISWVVNRKEK